MRAVKKGEFSPGESMFVCQLKLAGNNFPSIKRKFQDFFRWGYLKEKVYSPPPTTIPVLKRKIKAEFNKIPELMVRTAVRSMKKRANLMVLKGGKQFEGVN